MEARKKRRWYIDSTLLIYFICTFGAWVIAISGSVTGAFENIFIEVTLLGILSYCLFTIVHECAHDHFSNHPTLNYIAGFLASFAQGPVNSYSGYRLLHEIHHKHTNEKNNDPDLWSAPGLLPLPIKWMTTDLYYLYFYSIRMFNFPIKKNITVNIELGLQVGLAAYFIYLGYAFEVFFYWFLPSRISITILALVFNFLPHMPYNIPGNKDTTRNIDRFEKLLFIIFLGHNYHKVHHENLEIPFYQYRKKYKMQNMQGEK